MTNHLSPASRLATLFCTLIGAFSLTSSPLGAAVFYWDSDGSATNNNAVLGTNLGGTGTWDASAPLWYSSVTASDTVWPNLTTDTSIFNGTAGTVTITAGGINTGLLQFLTTGYALGGGQLTLGGTGANLFVGSAVTVTINSVIAGSNGLGLYGPGTLNLSAVNQYTGSTTLSNGATLNLDFTTNATDLIQTTSGLVLNSGTLKLSGVSGATDSQTFASTSVAGAGVITLTQNSAASLTVALGTITQTTGGSLNFSVVPQTTGVVATTSNANVSGILGTWASVGSGTSGLTYATVNGSNQIVAYTGGTTAATAAALTDTTGTVNYNLTTATGVVPVTFSANTIRYTGGAATTAPGATSFSVNGLMNSGTGLWTIGTAAITIGASKELEIITGSSGITISGVIQNNGGGASSLTYSGTGTLSLTKANTYTGTTTVNSGTLTLGIIAALNSASSLVVNGGVVGQTTFANTLASVTLRNGTINGTTGVLTSTAAFDLQSGTISAPLGGTAGLNKTTAGTVLLSQTTAGTLTGAINIKAGTLVMGGTAVSFAAANTINLGDSSGSADARLAVQNTLATYANPIVLNSGTTGNLSIGNQGTTAITFSNATTVSGTNNLIIANTGTGGLTLANVANIGTVTNSGSGTGATTISALGAGVTALNQMATGALTLTPAWIASQLGTIITNNGTGLLTLTGGVTGGSNLVFNANSTGGITVTAAMTATGTITTSGTGTGNVTLTAALSSSITNVLQNSSGTLTLTSAANAYTGTTTVSSGILSFAGTPVVTTTSGLGNSLTNIVLGSSSTMGTLVYTGAAATLSRNFTINAGGGEIDSTTATLTITPGGVLTSSNLTINPGGNLTFGGASNITLGGNTANVALISGTNILTKVGAGTLTLSTLGGIAAIQSAMPININLGTLAVVTTAVATVNPLGTGAITITPGGTLSFSNGGAIFTLPNNITIANAAGVANLTTSGTLNASGTITFAAGASIPTLKLNNTSSSTFSLNVSGAISGIGNLQLNSSAAGSIINVSGPQNQTGTISNVGSSTPLATLSGTIGSGISGISQAGANPFTVSSAIPLSASLNTFTSTGAGLWTFTGGFSGTQPLTFNTNSTGSITINTGAISSIGTLTNSGTGGGTTTISVNLGSNITDVLQSGPNNQLVLSGTNTYTGTTTVTAGVLDFTTTLAIPGYSTSAATAFGTISVASGATLLLPYGGPNSVTATDIANLLNGTYNVFSAGSSIGLDTTNASPTPAVLTFVLSDPGGTIGALNFTKGGTNALTVGAANTYTGTTAIVNGTLIASIINSVNGGTPLFAASSLGAPVTVANGTIHLGFASTSGTLSYTGAGETTDRVFDLSGGTGGGGIDNSGTGLLTIASPITFTGTGPKTLTLSGAGNINISSAITGSSSTGPSPLTIAKAGSGTVTLSSAAINTAATLTISGGILETGALGLNLANTGASTVVATGTGTINGKIFLGATNAAANGPDYNASAGAILTINAVIVNGASTLQNIDFNSATGGTIILTGANTFTGQVQINGGGTLQVSSINSVVLGSASSNLGTPSTAGNGTILLSAGGILKYTGTGETTDRIINLNGTTSGGTIDQSGTGLLKFTSNFTTPGAGAKTFVLQGSTAGTGEIAGVISQNSTTNTTAVTKNGTGTWTLSGTNTYTGATTVNGGNLILSQGAGAGALSNTGIVINSGGMLSALGGTSGYTVGNTATSAAGGRLTLNAGGTLNLADGVVNPLILVQGATFTGNAAVFAGGALNFDIGASTADQIDVRLNNLAGSGQATSSGINTIIISPIAGTPSLMPGSYTLISATATGSTLSNSHFFLASANLNVGGTLYLLTLSGSSGTEVLNVAVNSGAAVAPNTAYWNGTTNGSWAYQAGGNGTATNWSVSANGTPDTFAPPGSGTNVTFAATNATNLSTTLDLSFVINSLTFTGTGTTNTAGSTIASGTGANTLTINAAALNGNTAGNGITVNAGAGATLISAGVVLGSNQTWTNNSTNALTVSGAIGDGGGIFNLSIAGTGTIILSSAASTYSGVTTIGAGSTLRVGTIANGGLASGIGQSSSAAANLVINGTLFYNGATAVSDRSFTINAGATAIIDVAGSSSLSLAGATGAATTGVLNKIDTGTLTLTGLQTNTGNIVVNGGTLNLAGGWTGLAASSKLQLGTVAGNAIVNVSSNVTASATTGGTVAGSVSVYNQTAGTVTVSPGSGNTQYVGLAGYGYFNLTGGTYQGAGTNARFDVGVGTGAGVAYIGGTGVLNFGNTAGAVGGEYILIAYNAAGALGQMTVGPGGTVLHNGASAKFAIEWTSTNNYGVLNVAGGYVSSDTQSFNFGATSNTGAVGIINLALGTLNTNVAISSSRTAGGTGGDYINFVGGTISTGAGVTALIPINANVATTATIFGAVTNSASSGINTEVGTTQDFTGGAQFNVAGAFTTTITAVLRGATGYGVTQADIDIPVAGNSGYIGAPAVVFSFPAGGGVPASGYALISGGKVVGIVITSPGTYAADETPTITLTGGGGSIGAFATGPLATPNSEGGLTKSGIGTLTLSGANTFGGVLDIKGGILNVATITNGGAASGTLGTSSNAASNLLLNGGLLRYSGTVAGSTDRSFTIAASNGGFDASGTTAGTFTLTSTSAIAVRSGLGAVDFILQGTGTGTAGAGSLGALLTDGTVTTVSLIKNGTGTWTLANNASTYTGATTINGGILSVAALSAGGSASSIGASSNAASNLVLSSGTLIYTGSGSTSDRNYTFGNATTASGFTLDSEGTGALVITGGMTGVNTAASTQILSLIAAAGTGNNTISGVVDSNTGLGALTGVTKTGAGLWIIGGTSSYTGATTLTTGALQFAGSSALSGATAISMAAGTVLQIRDDAATITHTANNITGTSAGTVTVDVGNNGGATTGSTVAFGALNNGTAATANATIFNFTGSNGYLQSYSSLALAGLTGANTTLNPTTTSVTIIGNVTSQLTNGTTHFDALILDGTSTGNAINGIISDSAVYTSLGNGDTRVTKQNSSTWTLNGANTYTGPTAINGGTLALSSTGSLGNTAITVASGAVFAPTPGSGTTSAGSTGAGALGATLSISANGTLSMVDGSIGTFLLNTNTSFAGAALTLTSAIFNLELSSAGVDQIIVSGNSVASVITGTNTISITSLGASLTPGTYSILSAPGITASNTLFKFDNGTTTTSMTVGLLSYQLSLTSVAGIEQLVVGAGVGSLTWTGQTNGTGAANSVWAPVQAGNNNFADLSPAVADYSEGSAVTFQDLNLISGGNVTNSIVTIAAAGVNPGAVTVNNSAVNYTFQNASGSIGIAGSTSLTKTGAGTLTLLGQNTYTGPTSINGGIINVGVAEGAGVGPLGTANVISFGGGTLQYSAANQFDYSSRFSIAAGELISIDTNGQNVTFATALTSPGGTLTKNGAGKLTLSGINTFTGSTTVNGGTLTLTAANGMSGAMASPTITVNAGAVLDLTNTDTLGYTVGRNALVINGGTVQNNAAGKRNTITNTITMTGGFLAGTSLGDGSSGAFSLSNATTAVIATSDAAGNAATISANVSTQVVAIFQVNRGASVAPGAPDLIISGPITPYGAAGTNGVSYKGSGIVNITGANTYKGTTSILGGSLGGVVNANSTQALGNNTAGLIMGDNTGLFGTLNVNQNNSITTLLVGTSSAVAGTSINTITIAAGKTLTTTGAVTIGVGAAATNYTNLTVTGDTWRIGTSTTATNANVQLGINATTNVSNGVTVDLTGLTTFYANLGTGSFIVGETANSGGTGTAGSTLKLAPTSTILATTLSTDSPDGTVTQAIKLGTIANVIQANTINIGGSANRAVATLDFLSGTGTIQIRNLAGGGGAAMNVASGATTTGVTPVGTVDFTGHNADVLLSTLNIGGRTSATGPTSGGSTGNFSFDTGTLTATTVTLANRTGSSPTSSTVTGILNLMQAVGTTGTVTITTLNQGINSVSSATSVGAAVAIVNIGGAGTVGITAWNMGNISTAPGATAQVAGGPLQVTANISGSTTTIGTLTMNVNSSSATGTNKTSAVILNISGGAVNIGAGGISMANASNANAAATSTINVTGGSTLTLSGNITRAGGAGTETTNLNLNGATAVIDLGGGGSVHNIGSATATINTFTFTNGTLRNFGIIYGGITLAGTGQRVFNETGSFSGQVNGVITGSGVGIDKTGTGTITLLGANTFTGNIDIDGGTLVANLSNNTLNPTSSALGNMQVARSINVNNGGTLQFSSSDTFGGSTSTMTATLVINAGGTVTNDASGEFNTLGAVQLNGGTLTGVKGGGSAQAQMYSLQGSVTVGGTSASTISGPAAGGSTFGGYHLAANTAFNVADATGGDASDLVVSGVLIDRPNSVGAGGFTKSGAGTMTLTSTNTYSGSTTVNDGTLQVGTNATYATASAGTGSGAVNVNTGATLAGTGIVGGTTSTTTINSGAVLMPGDSTAAGVLTNGSLNIGGNLVVAAGGQIQLQIDTATVSGSLSGFAEYVQTHAGATALDYLNDPANAGALSAWNAAATPGSNKYDYLNVGGTLTLGHAAHEVSVTLNSYTTVTYGDVFNLLDWTTLTGIDATSLAGGFNVATDLDLSGLGGGLAWDTSAFTRYGIIVAAPEPARAALLLLGVTGLLLHRRRRVV